MKRLRAVLIALTAALALGVATPAAQAAATVNSSTSATLTLATDQTVQVAGSLSLTVDRFEANDDSIVLVARLNGQVSGTLAGIPVSATFNNVRVVAAMTNLQANCDAGTLSFNYRVTVPTQGITVTVAGINVPLRGAVTLRGSVTIATSQIADEGVADVVGALICEIDDLLEGGATLDDVVAVLNRVLSNLP